ncbi:MAG TPA: cytochrome C [Burkholderiaceae bacterium]|nr:cytochrome C [Burkholderiaceae bacterium]
MNRVRPRLAAVLFIVGLACGAAFAPHAVNAQAKKAPAPAKQAEPAPAPAAPEPIGNETCLACHGNEGFSAPGADGKPRALHVFKDKFESSVHGKRQCVECHKDITEVPHEKTAPLKVGCVSCHETLWKALEEDKTKEHARLGVVVDQIERYMKSVHARPSKEDQSRTNATCYQCHDAHYVFPQGTPGRLEWHLSIPNVCGKCHQKQRAEYATSVHGKAVLQDANAYAAVCSDCHTTHDVANPALDNTRLAITKNCGNCHVDSLKTYTGTYHGQVHTLGYAYTAKCFDCHGSHGIQRVADPASKVHADNRLETCHACHKGATAGFVTFEPHATTDDLARYPQVWLASKFMLGLLGGTFAFFWTHTALWFFREYKDRQQRKTRPHVRTGELLPELEHGEHKFFERFPLVWRIAHLVFAVSLMVLTLTGMAVFYADTTWAPIVINLFGGPQNAGLVHRVAAVLFGGAFFWHLIYIATKLLGSRQSFKWFGPDSLIPNLQDLKDIVAMFTWFIGKGPRPVFDRWTYWEKFDYWAPFWGVTIIGVSGAMLWFHNITAAYVPGWVFNVATIFHGEEALLAALFLFTVHFFNNHFRPDKFPLDVVMFTGAVPLEEFRREHTVQYNRLVETGQLSKYLVDAPSPPMSTGSKILGFTLIAFGLILLAFVVTGIIGDLRG